MRLLTVLALVVLPAFARAQSPAKPPEEADYYKLIRFDLPKGEVIEPGSLEFLPDGKLAIGTRRGEIWMLANPLADPKEAKFSRFARSLHEVLGLAAKDGWLYASERGDLIRMKDTKGNGRADLFEVVNDGWGINGDYHEYAFTSKFDKHGDLWIVPCLTCSFTSA